jgi:hypothetical protein
MAYVDPLGLDGVDWLELTHNISTGVAIGAGALALGCAATVVCLPIAPAIGYVSLGAGVVSIATDDATIACVTKKGSCAGTVVGAAMIPLGGLGKITKLGTFAKIGPGSAGGPSAGKAFPRKLKQQELDKARGEDGLYTCRYCGMKTDKPHLDHIIPRAKGGNATSENAHVTCAHCNLSKGARDAPVTPPKGYRGAWPW